ncbi:MAG: HAMP domain-containing protein [SAR324 cluster bacterium]|nr:HAMP domain-containing protein [SAR324 cluster bacterium]
MMPSRIRTKILVVFYIISAIPLIGYLVLYFQFRDQSQLTDQLIEKQQPIALGWVQLMSGINHSLAAQRGWVLFGTESFKQERLDAWKNEIDPNLEQLKDLYKHYESQRPVEVRLVFDIRLALKELEGFQNEIEKIAQTPENIPAQQLFKERMKPAFDVINENLGMIIAEESKNTPDRQKINQILNELRGSSWSSLASLGSFVLEGQHNIWDTFRENWATNERLLLDIQSMDLNFSDSQQSHFRQFLRNREIIDSYSEELFRLRSQDAWNKARYIMETRTIPLVRRIEESILRIVQFQSDFAKSNNQALQKQFEQWRILLLLVASGIFVMGFVLSMLLGRRVMAPLRELRDAVRYVKNEDFYGHIEVTTQDEVGELAQEFEEMLIAIRERTKDANRGRQILENSPFPVMLATPDRELVYLNPAALRELKRLTDFLPANPEQMLGKGIDFLLESTEIEPRQLSTPYNLPPSTDIYIGEQIIEVTFSPLFDSDHQYLGPVLHWKNATQERLNQQARQELVIRLEAEGQAQQKIMGQLEEQNKKLLAQVELDQAQTTIAKVINSLDVTAILEAGLETLVKTTNSQLGILYLDDMENESGKHHLKLKHYYTVDESVMSDEVYQVHGLPSHIFQTQKSSVIRNPAKHGKSFHLGSVASYPTMIVGYPLVFQERCLGVLLLASVAPFGEAILRFIENSVPQLAVSIQNATTFQTVQTQRKILQVANLELEAATQMKSEFLASMSHELRTPLNAIIGFAEALLDVDEENVLNPYQEDRLNRVHKSGKHLLELINSILDLSKIEARKMQVHVLSFNLKELLIEVIGLMEALVVNKPIELSLEIEDEIENCVSDQEKIRQIMINLLGNAVKFTEEGKILVHTSVLGDQLRIDVSDTGCGIPESQLDRIFETFRQVDGSETRHYEGSGLGLALVQSMSRLLGGDVSVVSREGEGSTFSVTLPMQFQHSSHPVT